LKQFHLRPRASNGPLDHVRQQRILIRVSCRRLHLRRAAGQLASPRTRNLRPQPSVVKIQQHSTSAGRSPRTARREEYRARRQDSTDSSSDRSPGSICVVPFVIPVTHRARRADPRRLWAVGRTTRARSLLSGRGPGSFRAVASVQRPQPRAVGHDAAGGCR
jgi:hypothetical protein